MDQNPYRAPREQERSGPGQLSKFLRLPSTVIEWVVIIVVALVIGAMLLPDVDDGAKAVRRAGPKPALKPGS